MLRICLGLKRRRIISQRMRTLEKVRRPLFRIIHIWNSPTDNIYHVELIYDIGYREIPQAPLIKSAALSATTYVGTWVWPAGIKGYKILKIAPKNQFRWNELTKTDASTTRRPITPLTRKSGLTTPQLVSPDVMAAVPTKWQPPPVFVRMNWSILSSVVSAASVPSSSRM